MTQKNYFQGAWVGCDASTGLGLPNWKSLAGAFDLPFVALDALKPLDKQLFEIFSRKGPEVILVPIDPNQTYFPKISSRVKSDGSMESAPLHQMTPSLSPEVEKRVLRYL
jgi:acetolactate synthase-1/2/3 large subunit